MSRTITTEATARREAVPDLARVDLSVTAGAPSASAARGTAEDRIAGVQEALTAVVDADDVRVTDRRISPTDELFEAETDAPYEAMFDLAVDCVPTTAGDVVVRATDAGATVDRVEFHCHESAYRRLQDDALEAAAERAREKAERVAAAEGLHVGAVRELSTSDSVGGMESIVGESLVDGNAAFQPEPVEVAATVEAVYDLE